MTTFHGAAVAQSSDIAVPTGGANYISWDTVLFDTDSFFSLGSPTKLTIPTTDKYIFGANATIEYTINGSANTIDLNGSPIVPFGNDATGSFDNFSVSGIYNFTAGDFIQLAINYTGTFLLNPTSPQFWIMRYS
jgi:hypothetical protein